MNKPGDLLKRIDELEQNMGEFSPIEGELLVSQELQQAVSTLIKLRYRGVSDWRVNVEYRFRDTGVQVKTRVRASNGPLIDFTESEAIIIAATLADKQSGGNELQ